jgi:hypothetical protein
MDLQFGYDYILTMGAYLFPLWSANEMSHQLAIAERRVYIGKLHYPKPKAADLCQRMAHTRGLFVNNRSVIQTNIKHFHE